ncbi:MAG: type III pantothenate kinase [Gammaproteobacteria bacterium]
MNRLYVDVGNSRIKYAQAGGAMAAIAHHGNPASALSQILETLIRPDEIIVADVTGVAAVALRGHVVRTLTASAASCGVTNGYPEPARLGADRWAALIGARVRHRGAVCVVDAGTAITVDAMSADGAHLGGWIAPGFALAVSALVQGTRFARTLGGTDGAVGFATDTAGAIHAGVRHSALGFVDRARRTATQVLGEAPQLLFCGGDAAALAAEFPDAVVDEPLVLHGLMAWADQP